MSIARAALPTQLFALLALALLASGSRPAAQEQRAFAVGDTRVELRSQASHGEFRVSFDAGRSWSAYERAETVLELEFARFDPLRDGEPAIPAGLRRVDGEQWILQFETKTLPAYRRVLAEHGVTLERYLPRQAFVIRASSATVGRVRALPFVRWVGPFHAAYRLDVDLRQALFYEHEIPRQRYVLMLHTRSDRAALGRFVERIGGDVYNAMDGTSFMQLVLTSDQLLRVAARREVHFVHAAGRAESDMDIVRAFGGANTIERLGGFKGRGVKGHILEGVYATHTEHRAISPYRTAPVPWRDGGADGHGNATFGIVFARGARAAARGLLPEGQGYYTNRRYVAGRLGVRKTLVAELQSRFGVMFQTASWGYSRTTRYNNWSAEMDELIYERDMPITQSQSNAGSTSQPRDSRPQAWAKNIIAVGGIRHYNSPNPATHRWAKSGSTGPAPDNRIKPDLVAFYDSIFTTGYSSSAYTQFGGTSGATPIVAGHIGLALELWSDGLFGYPMQAGGWQKRYENRPRFTTAKALMINTARPYPLGQATRDQQGWGFPNVSDLYAVRDTALVVNEIDRVGLNETKRYFVFVGPRTPSLRATMTWADPAASTSASLQRVDDLDLVLTSPRGTKYWGNHNARGSNWTSSGGSRNSRDTVENAFVQAPSAGIWQVDVRAMRVNSRRSKVPFALVVSGIRGNRSTAGPTLQLSTSGRGDLRIAAGRLPAGYSEGYLFLSFDTRRPRGHGQVLGMQFDTFSWTSLQWPRREGDPIHFTRTTSPTKFPNAPYQLPAGSLSLLRGFEMDGVLLFVGPGAVLDISNVSRVKL